jgi:spore maturation protein A
MSKVWGTMLILSIVISMITGNVSNVITSIMESSQNSIENVINLAGMMCFWSGIFNIFENTSILSKLSSKLKKIIYILFDKNDLNEKAVEYMSLNITSNIIGIGNASTLNGIKAINQLQKENKLEDIPNDNMTTFVLLNTASLQLIPTNIIALRSIYGATNPTDIVIPIWIVTACSLLAGISSIKFLNKRI